MEPLNESEKDRSSSPARKLCQYQTLVNKIFAYADLFVCKICYENPVNICMVPCGHVLCFECLQRLQKFECPFCKSIIDCGMKMYIGYDN